MSKRSFEGIGVPIRPGVVFLGAAAALLSGALPALAAGAKVSPAPADAAVPGPSASSAPPFAFWAVRALGLPEAEAREIEVELDAAAQRIAVVGHFVVLGREEVARRLTAPAAAALAVCDGAPGCVGEIAALCGARGVVAGQVGGLGGTYSVNLTLVSPTGSVIRRADTVLERGHALSLAAEEIVARLLAPDMSRGFLDLPVDVDGAHVFVDGAEVGISPLSGPISVTIGKHAVRVTHPAYHDFVQFVEIPYRAVVAMPVKLSAFPVLEGELTGRSGPAAVGAGKAARLPWWRSWWAVGTLGVVLLAGAATLTYFIALPDYDFTIRVRPM